MPWQDAVWQLFGSMVSGNVPTGPPGPRRSSSWRRVSRERLIFLDCLFIGVLLAARVRSGGEGPSADVRTTGGRVAVVRQVAVRLRAHRAAGAAPVVELAQGLAGEIDLPGLSLHRGSPCGKSKSPLSWEGSVRRGSRRGRPSRAGAGALYQ